MNNSITLFLSSLLFKKMFNIFGTSTQKKTSQGHNWKETYNRTKALAEEAYNEAVGRRKNLFQQQLPKIMEKLVAMVDGEFTRNPGIPHVTVSLDHNYDYLFGKALIQSGVYYRHPETLPNSWADKKFFSHEIEAIRKQFVELSQQEDFQVDVVSTELNDVVETANIHIDISQTGKSVTAASVDTNLGGRDPAVDVNNTN